MGQRSVRLFPDMVRFVLWESLRPRWTVGLAAVLGVALLETLLVLQSGGSAAMTGTFMLLGLLIVTSPLCRSWVDEDVRLGYGAFWLQKPVSAPGFYLVRLISAGTLAFGLGAAVALATLPALLLGSSSPAKLGELLIIACAVPVLLVFVSFFGSSLGVRNSGLFAYVLLFLGLWIGVSLAGPTSDEASILRLIEPLAPPIRSLLTAGDRLEREGVTAGLASLWRVGLYLLAVGGIGLVFATRAPSRLGRAD